MTLEREGHPGPRVFAFLPDTTLQSALRLFIVAVAGAEQSLGQQETPFAPPLPHPCRLAGGGGVALHGSAFLVVTLIRCRAATCTESGWACITPVHHSLFWWESCGFPPPSPLAAQLPSLGAELGEHVSSARGGRLSPGPGKPPGPGLENPALALRRAAECGASARPASRGLVSICPFCLRVKFAGENPTIRAKPLGGALPPPQPDPDRWKK